MKNVATSYFNARYLAANTVASSQANNFMGLLAKLFQRPNSTALAALHTQLCALKQENLRLKCQLEARGEPAELARLAYCDCLTGLANRRALQCAAQREMARINRSGRAACVVLADIDHFKAINDDFGHAQGDAVLRLIAETLRAQTRATDTVARWGGEEFALLLPETDLAAARIVAEKCRLAVQDCLTVKGVTMTSGVSALLPTESLELALMRADRAMYQGKLAGRNQVVVAE